MIARLSSFKSLSKTTKMLAMAGLLVTIGGAFAACSAASDDSESGAAMQTEGRSLPYLAKPCPGHGCM